MDAPIKLSYIWNGKRHTYIRPKQARDIPKNANTNRGYMPSLKFHLEREMGRKVVQEYESPLEHDFYLLLDQDQHCVDFQSQPVELEYTTKSGKNVPFYPDCWGISDDGREFLFEVKPDYKLKKLAEDENWGRKTEAIQQYCRKVGWKYQIVTEKKIRCVRLNNIKELLTTSKHYSPSNIRKNVGNFNAVLKQALRESPVNFGELVFLLASRLPHLEREEIISLLKYRIYFLDVFIDWDTPLEDTIVSLDGQPPVQVHDLPFVQNGEVSHDPLDSSRENVRVERDWKFEERLRMLTPVINRFGREGKHLDIVNFCVGNGLPPKKVYRLYRDWKKNGEDGLRSRKAKKHGKSHLDQTVEDLLQEHVNAWNTGEWGDKKSAYKDFRTECMKQGLKAASYKTFIKRTNALPADERRGKFRPKTQTYIGKALSGTYREGRHPGCVVQMDHMEAKIWLVDSFSKQPLGKPWITAGVDVKSRSIWGIFVSFDRPSQESMLQAILNGLTPKEHTKQWRVLKASLLERGEDPENYRPPCSGFPARIQVDNGMDFQANSVERFLTDMNITLEFRPTKTPEYGGFVESVWPTITDAIHGDKLPGRVYPLPKEQKAVSRVKHKAPPGYEPKKAASMTLEEFLEWLYEFIAIRYSTTPRGGQSLSPNEIWEEGLRGGSHQPMGGALRALEPSEFQMFQFLTKIPHSSSLSEKGLRRENILYTSDWLKEARTEKILKDKQKYEFRVSNWDIRWVYMLDPETNEIRTLDAYKYDGDDAITVHILKGLNKIPGYRPFRISMNDIKEANKALGTSKYDGEREARIVDGMKVELKRKAKATKREQKHREKLSKTEEGRTLITQSEVLVQLQGEPTPVVVEEPNIAGSLEEEVVFAALDELEACPTSFEEAKRHMKLSFGGEEDE